jgi:hypothetical protein
MQLQQKHTEYNVSSQLLQAEQKGNCSVLCEMHWLTSAHIRIVVPRLLQELLQCETALVHRHARPLQSHALLRQHDRCRRHARKHGAKTNPTFSTSRVTTEREEKATSPLNLISVLVAFFGGGSLRPTLCLYFCGTDGKGLTR